jgi:hypothetical protein
MLKVIFKDGLLITAQRIVTALETEQAQMG